MTILLCISLKPRRLDFKTLTPHLCGHSFLLKSLTPQKLLKLSCTAVLCDFSLPSSLCRFTSTLSLDPLPFSFFPLSFFFLAAPWHMELLGQGIRSEPLSRSCSNARSLTCCAGPGIEPDPIVPQWELQLLSVFSPFCVTKIQETGLFQRVWWQTG